RIAASVRRIVSPLRSLCMIAGPDIDRTAPNRGRLRLKQYATALVFLLHESVKLKDGRGVIEIQYVEGPYSNIFRDLPRSPRDFSGTVDDASEHTTFFPASPGGGAELFVPGCIH